MSGTRDFRVLAACGLALVCTFTRADDPIAPVPNYDSRIRPLLAARCNGCHGTDAQEGGVRFDILADVETAVRKRPLWKRAAVRVAADEMPPDGEPPLVADEKEVLLAWMRHAVEHVECGPPERRDPGPSLVRRLSPDEYDRTIQELLGVEFRSTEVGLAEEVSPEGFGNAAATLGLSPILFEKYLAAADLILERLTEPKYAEARTKLLDADPDAPERDAARQAIARLLRRAYRRPVETGEVDRVMALYDRAEAEGKPLPDRFRAILKPVLVSPNFLYRVERDRPAAKGAVAVPISDHELAVRMSYFLWASPPDEELSRLADEGRLSDTAETDRQVARMLADPKARALTELFALRWVQLAKLDRARPATEFFPTFNWQLKNSMKQEVTAFLDHLRTDDRSVLDLLDADYTFVDARLAKHYGIAGVEGDQVRKIELKPDDHRGGLLGKGAVLAFTSHTFRNSPTQRGKYVLEVLFGDPPPPPPPDAGMLKNDDQQNRRAPASFREQLAQHASQASCAGCHRKIDPIGFALDNYDPIGAWRESTSENPLDVSAKLPTGEAFVGADGLKQVLLARKDEFARNVASQMLVYALGRPLDYYDECAVRELTDELKAGDYRFSALVRGVVRSHPFRRRRAAEVEP